jgi:hypothetical protein
MQLPVMFGHARGAMEIHHFRGRRFGYSLMSRLLIIRDVRNMFPVGMLLSYIDDLLPVPFARMNLEVPLQG